MRFPCGPRSPRDSRLGQATRLVAWAPFRMLKADSIQALRRAALSGLGVVMLLENVVSDDVIARRLVRLLPGYEPPSLPMHIVYLPDRRMSRKLRTFVDFVIERFG